MQSTRDRENGRLIAEIESYLRVVDTFRREGCEPRWLAHMPATYRGGTPKSNRREGR